MIVDPHYLWAFGHAIVLVNSGECPPMKGRAGDGWSGLVQVPEEGPLEQLDAGLLGWKGSTPT